MKSATLLPADFSPHTNPSDFPSIGDFEQPTQSAARGTILFIKLNPQVLTPPESIEIDDFIASEFSTPSDSAHIRKARGWIAENFVETNSLAALRLKKGLSQKELADRVQSSQSHLANIELGKCDPGTQTILKIAKALDVPAERIFSLVATKLASADF